MIKTSARNQLEGVVVLVHPGAVNDTIDIDTAGGQRIVANITCQSTAFLGLAPGVPVTALVKASSVIIARPEAGMRLSARNQWAGSVGSVAVGAVNAEVVIDLEGGGQVVAIVTNQSAHALGLVAGMPVLAIVKASSVILATSA